MNEDLKYRKAEPADAERIMEIIRQAQAQMRALGSRTATPHGPISTTT